MPTMPGGPYPHLRPRVEVMPFNSGLSAVESSDPSRKLWKNAERDKAIVQVSTAFHEGRWEELQSLGILKQRADVPSHLLEGRRTDVLVSNAQHAQRLSLLLGGSSAIGDRRLRPTASVTTFKEAGAGDDYSPTVVINSRGSFPGFSTTIGDPPMGRVFVELFDDANDVTKRDGL